MSKPVTIKLISVGLLLSVFTLCFACNLTDASTDPPATKSTGPNVLFIGNSLTYANDLPGMLEKMMLQAGVIPGLIESVAEPNYALQDHWAFGKYAGKALNKIKEGHWDVVALQQGPSATEGRPSLLEYSQIFDEEIRKAGGKTALYMVWPSDFRAFDFDGVSDSYRTAAELVNGLLFPAGEAWRAAWRRDSTLSLYAADRFHPSPLGTYLAALVIFDQLVDYDINDLPSIIPLAENDLNIANSLSEILKAAAIEANTEFGLEP